jgi:hypothetical protein
VANGTSKEEKIELEGQVVEAFRSGMFKVALENGHETLGYTAGKMRLLWRSCSSASSRAAASSGSRRSRSP